MSSDSYSETSDDDSYADDDSDQPRSAHSAAPPLARKRLPKDVWKYISEIAQINSLATDASEDDGVQERLGQVDPEMMERIKKALSLAQHSGTGEAEAKAALRSASKLMAKVNITHADIMAQESANELSQRGGMSTVDIIQNPKYSRNASGKGPTKIQRKSWHNCCVSAMKLFFDVKTYSTSHKSKTMPRIRWTFYGIAANTAAAANAFEMVHNIILTWSHERKDLKGLVQHNSYKTGVGQGLMELAKEERATEERLAIEQERKALTDRVAKEEEERKAELARLHGPTTEPAVKVEPGDEEKPVTVKEGRGVKLEEVDDEEAMGALHTKRGDDKRPYLPALSAHDSDDESVVSSCPGFGVGFDEEDDDDEAAERAVQAKLDRRASSSSPSERVPGPDVEPHPKDELETDVKSEVKVVPEPEPEPEPEFKAEEIKTETIEETDQWQSALQLRTFRKNAEMVADEYIKESKLKIKKGRKRKANLIDHSAYKKGVEDSKKIDVKRRRLEGPEDGDSDWES